MQKYWSRFYFIKSSRNSNIRVEWNETKRDIKLKLSLDSGVINRILWPIDFLFNISQLFQNRKTLLTHEYIWLMNFILFYFIFFIYA